MDKRILVQPYSADGTPLLQVLDIWQGRVMGSRVKTAARYHPAIQEFLRSLVPDRGCQYILSAPVGAYEVFGSNLNADAFRRAGLANKTATYHGRPYGFRTWLTAGAYRHHVNQDPGVSFGSVKVAAYCDEMDRCLVILAHDRKKAAAVGASEIVEAIDGGEFPPISMGTRVPGDECSICFNFAKTAADYCNHLNGLDPRYGKNRVLPDGRICVMHNDYPAFFDHSYVSKNAAHEAAVLEKVAALTGLKSADLFKQLAPYLHSIRGRLASSDVQNPMRGLGRIRKWYGAQVAKGPAPPMAGKIASSAAALGLILTPQEFQALGVRSTQEAQRLLHPSRVDPALLAELLPDVPDRSIFFPHVQSRVAKLAHQPPGASPAPSLDPIYHAYRAHLLVKLPTLLEHATNDHRQLYHDHFFRNGSEKVAAPNAILAAAMGLVPMVYLASAHWREGAAGGEKLGMIESFISKHPGFTSALLTGAAFKTVQRASHL